MVAVSLPRNGHYRRLQGALGRGRGRGRRGEPIPGVSGCGGRELRGGRGGGVHGCTPFVALCR